jgi:peptidoglycan/xylan/chitin deacetylase (PgdA/CDA1 family)
MQALGIMYHDVVEHNDFDFSGFPGASANIYKLRRKDFERHLDAIARATAAVSTVFQLEGRPVLLTFDDGGVSSHHPIADLLESRGWRGHFFITTDRIGTPGFLTEAHLRELHRRGHIVGSHSCSHPTRMAALTRADLDREWRQSIARLAAVLGDPVKVASVPGGYFSRDVAESAAAAGIEALFTSEPTARVEMLDGCRVLGRYVVQRGMAPEWSAGFASGSPSYCWRQSAVWGAKRAFKSVLGANYLRLRHTVLERKG